MNLNDKYFNLCYTKRIHEFAKIDSFKKWEKGQAKEKYRTIDDFYLDELQIDLENLKELRNLFKQYDELYRRYRQNNIERNELFSDYKKLLKWYNDQNECCNYCQISQADLFKIVSARNGNLTLNQKTKRSKGTLEIEKLNPNVGYTPENSVLACPFCNNAKSNLISENDWRTFFTPAMKEYFKNILADENR